MSGGILSRKVIIQTPFGPINVVQESSNTNIYSGTVIVAGFASATLINFTIPIGKKFSLSTIEYNGENVAIYSIELNASTIAQHHLLI